MMVWFWSLKDIEASLMNALYVDLYFYYGKTEETQKTEKAKEAKEGNGQALSKMDTR
jgi:hypothetical protein